MPAPPRRWERLQMFNLSTGARKRANDAWFMWYIHITHRLLHAASDSRPKTLPHSVYICRLFRVAGTVEIASSWDLCIHSQWRPDRMKKTSPSAHTQHKKQHLAIISHFLMWNKLLYIISSPQHYHILTYSSCRAFCLGYWIYKYIETEKWTEISLSCK